MSIPHSIQAEYDVVFAGGGAAACIIASRLATALPHLKFLVLESGPTTKDKDEHRQPGRYLTHLLPTSTTMQFYASTPTENVAGRSVIVPSGRCIGGGSSVNFMLYNRPAASDLDEWETEYGNAGWGSKDLIPLMKKAETYEVEPHNATHGSDGPLKVSYGAPLDLAAQFLEIGPKFEKNRPFGDEGNGFDAASVNKFYQMPKWISRKGHRSDVPHHYIYNKSFDNLSVFDGCRVNRVITENGAATGLEYLFDRRLVIVSAGAMGSPLILERSGIGKKDILDRAGIPMVVELPGVGENYQDHLFVVTPYIAEPDAETFDPIFRGDPETWGRLLTLWAKDGSGLMGGNGVDCAIKMRPHPDELAELGPDFIQYWNDVFAKNPDKPLFWLSALAGLPADQSALPPIKYLCSGCFLGYPTSRGHVHIASSDLYAAPDFQCAFLSNDCDLAALRWGYKKGRELIRRLPSFRGALVPGHPQFAPDSPAALTETGPVPLDAPKVVYSAEDDKAIDDYVRQWVATTWHSLGTCAMKPRDRGGVVDSKLNVYGIGKLKVADLSIPPSNVNSNTYSAAVAVAEKAAIIIAAELGGKI
ncbi:GMC oxidoreductase-domain-containing protein [Mycena pura]|uniref:GMC oxidoreductase-domain-containing protein n=1 Tax=Mycena pura TaxID=153505 RepID=A0AAD6VKX5_9AGAR|nr:GMC oxidoreductase-domain-containing protein [Mycena pura]